MSFDKTCIVDRSRVSTFRLLFTPKTLFMIKFTNKTLLTITLQYNNDKVSNYISVHKGRKIL